MEGRIRLGVFVLVMPVALLVFYLGKGCASKSPPPPPMYPSTLPSEEEARRVRREAREALAQPRAAQAEPSSPDSAAKPQPRLIDGYRVQILATSEEARAQRAADAVRSRLGEAAYVEYEGLLYKVRIGDCASWTEAERLRKRLLDAGFEGAFIVRTRIEAP